MKGGRAWVVTVGDEAVGYRSARIDGEVAETCSVVAAGYQGRGIGAAARAASGTEVRRSPHGEEVELERWELDLRAWSRRSAAERAPQPVLL